MTNQDKDTLEARIAAILSNRNAASETLYEAVEEVRAAISVKDRDLPSLKEKAYDLGNPNREAVERSLGEAERNLRLLQNALPRLEETLAAALDRESRQRWSADHSRVGVVTKQADDKMRRVPEAIQLILDAFATATHADQLASELHGRAPSGESKRFELFRDRHRALS